MTSTTPTKATIPGPTLSRKKVQRAPPGYKQKNIHVQDPLWNRFRVLTFARGLAVKDALAEALQSWVDAQPKLI